MGSPDLAECDDLALLARARTDDRPAFGELVRRHQHSALRVAAVISGSTEEAKDIVQDAFVNIHRKLDSYRGTGSVRSWMLRVVANHAKNHVRSRIRRLRREDQHAGLFLREEDDTETTTVQRMENVTVAKALGRLPLHDREVLGCRYVAELSEAETAEVLAVAIGTVKSRTSRALAKLQTEFERAESKEPK
ncbi:MAG: sigma-70 family RNA polymerase sigma factor [Ilumatobacteraceae bacterium]